MTNERRNWLFSHIVFGYSQGANMCLLNNHYLTQFKDTELISVQRLQVLCKYVFGYRQLCKCQVTLIQQSSIGSLWEKEIKTLKSCMVTSPMPSQPLIFSTAPIFHTYYSEANF